MPPKTSHSHVDSPLDMSYLPEAGHTEYCPGCLACICGVAPVGCVRGGEGVEGNLKLVTLRRLMGSDE